MGTNLFQGRTATQLVILPGLMCDSRMFPGVSEVFPGTVFADGFYPGAASIEAMAERTLERLPDRFALLGHSMGARVAMEIWKRAPARVDRLALVDTGTHPARPGEREQRYALRDIGRELGFARLIEEWLPPMVADTSRARGDLMRTLQGMACSAGQETFERQIEALLLRPDADPILPTIDCPTFVIVGEEDGWSPVGQHRLIASRVPHAELRIVPGAGHMAPAEAPEAFRAIVREWLDWQPDRIS